MSKKPILHDLKPDFNPDRITCDNLKIKPIFNSLPAVQWNDVNQLVNSYVEKHESDEMDKDKAFSQICTSLETIRYKRRRHLALSSYCTDLLRGVSNKTNMKRISYEDLKANYTN